MSDEVKKDNTTNAESSPKTEDAKPENAKATNENANGSKPEPTATAAPAKSRGIGFLGRRGTAPIRTDKDADKKDEAHKDEKPAPPPKPMPVGFAEKVFFKLGDIPALATFCLILILFLHSFASIWLPSIFFAQELHLLEVYSDMQGMGQWFIPPATEHIQSAFPGFFWLMALIDVIPLSDSIFLPLMAVFCTLIVTMGVYTLALCVGLDNKASFAAGLLALASPAFATLGHCISPEFLAAGLFAFALAFLHRAWVSNSAVMYFILGFFFAVLAALSGGFLPLWTILISSICFIIWRGTFGRAHKIDAVMGFGVLVLVFAIWLLIIIIGGGPQAEALNQLMQQIIIPFTPPFWPLKEGWYYGLLLLSIGLIPWIFLPLFVSWTRVFKNAWSDLKAARKEKSGSAWLYINLVVGCILLASSAELNMAISFLPILIVLLAKALCNLSALGSKIFYAIFAFLAFVAALVCLAISFAPTSSLWADYIPQQALEILNNIQGLEVLSTILLVGAVILFKFTKRTSPGGSLLVVSLFMILFVQPFTMLIAPSLVDKAANYHPLGAGKGILPYGLGAPAQAVIPLDSVQVPTEIVAPPEAEQAPEQAPAKQENQQESTPPAPIETLQEPEAQQAPDVTTPEETTPEALPPAEATDRL